MSSYKRVVPEKFFELEYGYANNLCRMWKVKMVLAISVYTLHDSLVL